jgi:UDP-N-acetyl-D-glucosamine dehydrogenase
VQALERKITDRSIQIGVIGLGYVGLPLAVEFARAGFRVHGLDVDAAKAAAVARGESYIGDVPRATVRRLVRAKKLTAGSDFDALAELDAVSICVPTPLRKTRDPDVSYIVGAVEEIAKRLHRGQLVILESTTYPGTTDELILPMLQETGFTIGTDFFLAFSPERVDPGNKQYTTRTIPKVVGGVTPECTRLAVRLYEQTLDRVIPVSSTRVAEMVKLVENTFRSVNIGLVNEIALMCDHMNIDVWEVIDAAASKPFGFMPFYPGPGLGGHCIPIDPYYLSWKAKMTGFEARFIELAGHVNASMPYHVVSKVTQALNTQKRSVNGARLLFLGIAYKADIDDVRESPALDIMHMLREQGAAVAYHDPYVPVLNSELFSLASRPLTRAELRRADCVVITTAHRAIDWKLVARASRLVVDTRNALASYSAPHVFKI